MSDLKGLDTADLNEFIQECASDPKTKLSLGQKSKLRKMIKAVNEPPAEAKMPSPQPVPITIRPAVFADPSLLSTSGPVGPPLNPGLRRAQLKHKMKKNLEFRGAPMAK